MTSATQTFAGKTVLITGASRGIGAEVARDAARAGAHVLLVARNREALQEVAASVTLGGGRASIYPCDLSVSEAVDALADAVLRDHAGADIVIHNAARSIRRPLAASMDRMHDFRRTMELNYFAAVQLTMRLLPSLRERRGSVCLVLSMGVLIPGPYFAAYLASKTALGAFGDSLAAEFRHEGVHAASIYLPLVRTEMMAPTKAYAGLSGVWSVQRASGFILDAVASRRRRAIPAVGNWLGFSNLFRPGPTTRVLNILRQTFPTEGETRYPRLQRVLKRTIGGSPL